MREGTRPRSVDWIAAAIVWAWELIKVCLFATGCVFVVLRIAGALNIGNFYFYYGPDKVTIVKEHQAP